MRKKPVQALTSSGGWCRAVRIGPMNSSTTMVGTHSSIATTNAAENR